MNRQFSLKKALILALLLTGPLSHASLREEIATPDEVSTSYMPPRSEARSIDDDLFIVRELSPREVEQLRRSGHRPDKDGIYRVESVDQKDVRAFFQEARAGKHGSHRRGRRQFDSRACGASGQASWYGDPRKKRDKFHGRTAANGRKFNTFAHVLACNHCGGFRTVDITHNGVTVTAQVVDTGGFDKYGRIADLSWGLRRALGMGDLGRITIQCH